MTTTCLLRFTFRLAAENMRLSENTCHRNYRSEMFDDFKIQHKGVAGYEKYRQTVAEMKMSFAKLGEECEVCMAYKLHATHDYEDTCQFCNDQRAHKEKAKQSRARYINK